MTHFADYRVVLVAAACLLTATAASADGRSAEDTARDAQRRPTEVLEFLGLQKGDTVLDVWAAGVWYTEVLSIAVGPEGRVYSQNSPRVLGYRDGYYDKALSERLAGGRLANVVRIDQDLGESPIEAGSVDLAITALNTHDVYEDGESATVAWLESIRTALKPGGVLGLIDHVGVDGADNAALHRMRPDKAKAAVVAAGFVIEEESDLLANPEDDHTKIVFDPDIRGKTDRFILKLRKPE